MPLRKNPAAQVSQLSCKSQSRFICQESLQCLLLKLGTTSCCLFLPHIRCKRNLRAGWDLWDPPVHSSKNHPASSPLTLYKSWRHHLIIYRHVTTSRSTLQMPELKPLSSLTWIIARVSKLPTLHVCPTYIRFASQQPQWSIENMSDYFSALLRTFLLLSMLLRIKTTGLTMAHETHCDLPSTFYLILTPSFIPWCYCWPCCWKILGWLLPRVCGYALPGTLFPQTATSLILLKCYLGRKKPS